MKENYGNLDILKELGKTKTLPFTKEQLQDNNLKNIDGESYNDVITRMNNFFDELIHSSNENDNIAVVSHGAAIKFYLSQFCKLNQNIKLVFNDNILSITSPCVLKLEFRDKKLINISQIF